MILHKAYISAGSNLGDRLANLEFALVSLKKSAIVSRVSSWFETEPVGFADQPWFLNLAMELETNLAPLDLLALCQAIEENCGRIRTFRYAPRTLDLDILLYNDTILNDPKLTIPHPRMAERRFVLVPLAQIAPEIIHPVLKKSIRLLLEACADPSGIRVFRHPPGFSSSCDSTRSLRPERE